MQHWGYAGIHLHVHLPAIYAYAYCYRTANTYCQASRDTEVAADSATKARAADRSWRNNRDTSAQANTRSTSGTDSYSDC